MSVKSGKKFCGEHAVYENASVTNDDNNSARMPCPYDSNQ